MHDYSIDNHPKEKILFFLAIIAVSLAPTINDLVKELNVIAGWSALPATTISLIGIYGAIYWLFNKYFWRCSALRRCFLVPDLNGEWLVDGSTILKNGEKVDYKWNGTITITQSWSKMKVYLQTAQSSSTSVAASIQYQEDVGYCLLYQYNNSPSADQLELKRHSGTVEILFDLNCNSALGHYYTDQNRNTVGQITLIRKGDNVN